MAERKEPRKSMHDVLPAGNTTPSETSRPVILPHKPMMKDPMMVDTESKLKNVSEAPETPEVSEGLETKNEPKDVADADASSVTAIKVQVGGMKELTPTKDAQKSEDAEDKTEEVTAEPEAESPAKEESKEDVPSKDFDESEPADIIMDPDAETKEAEEALAKEEAIQKMVDSREFYLPINAIEQKRTQRFIALGIVLSIVLVLAWIDISLDAGLVHLGSIKPVTHFFSS